MIKWERRDLWRVLERRIINHFRKQHKRANLDKIYNELIKTIDSENANKEYLHDKIN